LPIRFFALAVFSLARLPALMLSFGRRAFVFVVFFATSGLTFTGALFFWLVGFLGHAPDTLTRIIPAAHGAARPVVRRKP
jgi:apolipoprotein N-acyltransferase